MQFFHRQQTGVEQLAEPCANSQEEQHHSSRFGGGGGFRELQRLVPAQCLLLRALEHLPLGGVLNHHVSQRWHKRAGRAAGRRKPLQGGAFPSFPEGSNTRGSFRLQGTQTTEYSEVTPAGFAGSRPANVPVSGRVATKTCLPPPVIRLRLANSSGGMCRLGPASSSCLSGRQALQAGSG